MNRILIVDDEYIARNKLRFLTDYAQYGFQIAGECTNGTEAIDFINAHPVDVVFTDVYMPETDGIALTEYICRNHPQIAVVIFSNYSELDYVRRAFSANIVDYQLKQDLSEAGMTALLKRVQAHYLRAPSNETFLSSINRASVYRSSIISAVLGQEDTALPDNSVVAVMHIENQKLRMQFFSEEETVFLYQNISNTIANIVKEQKGYVVFSHNHELICCLPFAAGDTEAAIMHKLGSYFRSISYAVYKIFNLSVLWGVSAPSSASRSAHACYCEAKQMLQTIPISAKNTMRSDEITFNSLSAEQEMNLLTSLSSQNIDTINACLEELFKTVDIQKSMDILIGELVSVATRFCSDFNLSISGIEPMNNKMVYSIQDYLNWSKNIFGKITANLKNALPAEQGNQYVTMAKEYIQKNYSKDISRNSIADYLNINKDYLTRLFKEETGDTILNYINSIRVTHAKKLLEQGDVNMSILSSTIGFHSRSYFSTVFKKYTGLSPEQYRAKYKNNKKSPTANR